MSDIATQLAFEMAWEEFKREHPLWVLCVRGPAADADHVQKAIPLHPREVTAPEWALGSTPIASPPAGEVDLSNSHLLRAYLAAASALADLGDGPMTLDLSSTSFDLQGVRDLIELRGPIPSGRCAC